MSILNNAKQVIQEARERIDQAEKVYDTLRGKRSNEYRVKEYDHGFVMVDDGQDRWLATSEDYSAALCEALKRVIEGKIHPDDAYAELCGDCECLYSKIGSGAYNHDLGGLRSILEDSKTDADAIFADLGIEVARVENDE